jgi:hypothetical protein
LAILTKLKSGSWRVQVRRRRRYVNETFLRRKDAEEWALVVLELPALHRISVVVRREVLEALAGSHRRCSDDGRFDRLQPCEG